MSADVVAAMADQLRQYATHFAFRDWDYTRDTGELAEIRYDRREDSLRGRIAQAWRWLTKRQQAWEKTLKVSRVGMALYALRRDKHLPDGILDGGCIITFWEETGEYLQYVQPTVGAMLADWMDSDPESPHAQRVAAEMKRINDRYGERVTEVTP